MLERKSSSSHYPDQLKVAFLSAHIHIFLWEKGALRKIKLVVLSSKDTWSITREHCDF